MNKINSHKEVISEIKKLRNVLLSEIEITDISNLSVYPRKDEKLPSNKYFILHHSVTDKDAAHVVSILNNRKNRKTGKKQPLGIQYVIDKEGKVFSTLPIGSRGAHIIPSNDYPSAPPGIDNSNAQGVEVVAMDDTHILPVQAVAALELVKQLGFKPSQIYPHGKINPGHKSPSEGLTIKKFIDRNYDKDEDDYDYSDFPKNKRPENGVLDYEVSDDKKDPNKLEQFLDYVGISDLSDVKSGDKKGKKNLMDKASELFPDDIIDIDGEFRLFGYSLDDVLDAIEDILPKLESIQKKKNLIEDVKKIKSRMIK
jgi:hypothetical protein